MGVSLQKSMLASLFYILHEIFYPFCFQFLSILLTFKCLEFQCIYLLKHLYHVFKYIFGNCILKFKVKIHVLTCFVNLKNYNF